LRWLAISALIVIGTRGRAVVPSRTPVGRRAAYGFTYKMVEDVAGKDALPFFPYIFTLFMFILFANFLG
jgi:F-type H+-transporting ATPase subunit a